MVDVLQQQVAIERKLFEAKRGLNQTMRESLAKPMDSALAFQTLYANGAYMISRRVNTKDLVGDTIPKFEKSPTTVIAVKDLKEEDVRGVANDALPKLLERFGLIDIGISTVVSAQTETLSTAITVQYPLKGYFDKKQFTNARFTINAASKQKLVASGLEYTLLHGQDPENNAFFFRVTPVVGLGIVTQFARECVVIFNKSHRLEMSSLKLPGQCREFDFDGKAHDKYAIITDETKFDAVTMDATLYFLRSKFPTLRFVASVGGDNGFPNECDVVSMTSHIRRCTWEMAHLHWVYEGLCSVIASMVMANPDDPKLTARRAEKINIQEEKAKKEKADEAAKKFLKNLADNAKRSRGPPKPPPLNNNPGQMPNIGSDPATLSDNQEDKPNETHSTEPPSTAYADGDRDGTTNDTGSLSSSETGTDEKMPGLPMGSRFLSKFTLRSAVEPEIKHDYESFKTWLLAKKTTPTNWATCLNVIHNYIVFGKLNTKPIEVKFGSCSHDDALKQIAKMAKLATDIFTVKMEKETNTGLVKLTSPYNSFMAANSAAVYDFNSIKYFGYKLTQWLLSDAETHTVLVAKSDKNTKLNNIRGRIRNVDCQFHTAGLKSTYTTDVLMEILRSDFIFPWSQMFGGSSTFPEWLNSYSFSSHFSKNVAWRQIDTIDDKLVSVILRNTYKIRFVFDAFRRKIEGSDPVVVSKQWAEAWTKAAKGKKSKSLKWRKKTKRIMLDPKSVSRVGGRGAVYTWQTSRNV